MAKRRSWRGWACIVTMDGKAVEAKQFRKDFSEGWRKYLFPVLITELPKKRVKKNLCGCFHPEHVNSDFCPSRKLSKRVDGIRRGK